jgi:hypothetical protein
LGNLWQPRATMRGIALWLGLAALFGTGSAFAQDPRPIEQDARAIEVEAAEARVSVQIEPATATLLQRNALAALQRGGLVVGGFRELCTGSCRLKLKAGVYSLALSLDGNDVTSAKRVAIPAGDSTLKAHYQSHSGKLVAGWLLIGTSPVTWVGSGLLIKAIRDGDAINGAETVLITGLALAQLATGIVLVATGADELGFDIVPLSAARASLRGEVAQTANALNGLGLRLTF